MHHHRPEKSELHWRHVDRNSVYRAFAADADFDRGLRSSKGEPMHRTVRIGALAAVLAAGAAATAASGHVAGGGGNTEVINAARVTEDGAVLDLGTDGLSLGDERVFTARFEVDGDTIGFDGGVCTLVRKPQTYQCVATNVLPKGQLTAQALVDFDKAPGPYHFAITGGTDGYRTARGDVEVLFGENSDTVSFRIVTRPGRH
jgi:hypothetical protein